uniref:Uncharacterized protein ycf33 n=1 Tax=Wrangelia sp. TaxID=2575620 RepID=A0A4D6X628_9FLOR|nr:hypothetical protein [Wrangelia sp.]
MFYFYFWNNINKFPRFFIATILGFFLITFRPIFRLLRNDKKRIIIITTIATTISILYKIITLMLNT